MTDYGLNTDDVIIGTYGGAFAAPTGTTLPTAYDTVLASAFVPLGWFSEQGPKIPTAPNVQEIRAWQSADPIAARVKERSSTVEFEMMQWNADTLPFAYGGGSITTAGGGYVYTPPSGEVVDEYSLVLDVLDGSDIVRYVFERGYPAAGTAPGFNRDGAALLSVGYKVLTPADGDVPFRIYSNIAGWNPGS